MPNQAANSDQFRKFYQNDHHPPSVQFGPALHDLSSPTYSVYPRPQQPKESDQARLHKREVAPPTIAGTPPLGQPMYSGVSPHGGNAGAAGYVGYQTPLHGPNDGLVTSLGRGQGEVALPKVATVEQPAPAPAAHMMAAAAAPSASQAGQVSLSHQPADLPAPPYIMQSLGMALPSVDLHLHLLHLLHQRSLQAPHHLFLASQSLSALSSHAYQPSSIVSARPPNHNQRPKYDPLTSLSHPSLLPSKNGSLSLLSQPALSDFSTSTSSSISLYSRLQTVFPDQVGNPVNTSVSLLNEPSSYDSNYMHMMSQQQPFMSVVPNFRFANGSSLYGGVMESPSSGYHLPTMPDGSTSWPPSQEHSLSRENSAEKVWQPNAEYGNVYARPQAPLKNYSQPAPNLLYFMSMPSIEAGRNRCPVCGKAFKRPLSLQIHFSIHTGEKMFKCEWQGCGRLFNVKSNMKRHYRLHLRRQSERHGFTLCAPGDGI